MAAEYGFEVRAVQSNHEGVLIDAIHAARADCAGIVINPAAYSHTSVAIADALTPVGTARRRSASEQHPRAGRSSGTTRMSPPSPRW